MLFGSDGLQQYDAGKDVQIIGKQNILNTLGDDAGVYGFHVKNLSGSDLMYVNSEGDVRVTGNLLIDGEFTVINSNEINIGDSFVTFNADIEYDTLNSDGGLFIKRLVNTSGQILVASVFDNATSTITIASGPGILSSGDLFYIKDSDKNDGLYEVDTIDAVSIVIKTTGVDSGVKTSIVDETGATAKTCKAKPAYLIYNNSSDYWNFGYFESDGTRHNFKMTGMSAGGATDFSDTNPDLSAQGTSNITSASYFIGIYDEFDNSNSLNVQGVAKDFDTKITDLLAITDGKYVKNGTAAIVNASNTVSVTFGTAFSATCASVVAIISNTTDPAPTFYGIIVTSYSTTGFTITLSNNTDSANYSIHWHAYGN